MSIWDEPKIDCHCHVLDPARFPYQPDTAYRPWGQEVAPVELLLAAHDTFGVTHGLLVGTNSGYGTDNRIVLDAISRAGGRLKGIAVVPNDIGIAALAALQTQGIVGVAFNPSAWGVAHYADAAPLIGKLAELDMLLQIQTERDQLLDMLALVGDAKLRLLLDHCARPVIDAGLAQPGFAAALELGRSGRAWVKLSGYTKFSAQLWPYADAAPFVQALVTAFGIERCLWASDWPYLKAAHRVDFGMMLRLVAQWFPDADARAKLLHGNAARLFGFVP